MKLAAELLAGVVACGVAYVVARPGDDRVQQSAHRDATPTASFGSEAPAERSPPPASHVAHTRAVATASRDASVEDERAMMTLRNELVVATSADMQRRGEDVVKCLGDIELAGVQKLRFAVDIESTAHEAVAGSWRFVEVVDGEPLPASFEHCAARALGGGYRLTPPTGFEFPRYRGRIDILYTIPAPP